MATQELPLSVRNISKRFGATDVLESIDLQVEAGQRHVLFGPNGAGKTTLFNIISGRLTADAGTISIFGTQVDQLPVHDRARLGLVRTQQITSVFRRLSIEENLFLAAQATGPRAVSLLRPRDRTGGLRDQVDGVLDQWGWAGVRHEPASTLSYGEQRRLEMAVALMQRPRVLLLDEPMAGLTEAESHHIAEIVVNLGRDVSVLLVEHHVSLALTIADRVSVMHNGHIVATGTPDEISDDPVVQRVYLGTPARGAGE